MQLPFHRSKLPFHRSKPLTLGVEMELQILDATSKALSPSAPEVLKKVDGDSAQIKPELFRSMVEINTRICHDVSEVRADLTGSLRDLQGACAELGLNMASAGTHPFAHYDDHLVYPSERFESLLERNRWLASRLMIFGLHVHVGVRNGQRAMTVVNGMLHYLPHLLALSSSSPFWQSRDTGLASSRITIFEALPTAGHPCVFKSWTDFEQSYAAMVQSGAIGSIKDIWWDVRPHPDFGTIEVRVCDALPTLTETIAIVALIQALVARFNTGKVTTPPPYWILRENKWRAARWGLDTDIVLDEKGRSAPLRDEIEALVDSLAAVSSDLGCADELRMVRNILSRGASHQRQRAMFERTGSHVAVADALVRELKTDLDRFPS